MPRKNPCSHEDSSHQSTIRRSPRFLLRPDGEQSNSKENQVCFTGISSAHKNTHPTQVVSPEKSGNRRQPLRIIDSVNGLRKPPPSISSSSASSGFSSRRDALKSAPEKTQVEDLGLSEKRTASESRSKRVCENDRRRSLRLMGLRMGDVDCSSSSREQIPREVWQKGECREERRRSLRLICREMDGERSHDVSEKRVSSMMTKKVDVRSERRRSLRLIAAGEGLIRTTGSLEKKISHEMMPNGNNRNERRQSLGLIGYKKQEGILSGFSNKENPSKRHQKGGLGNVHSFSEEIVSSKQSSLGLVNGSKELEIKTGNKAMVNVTAPIITSPKEGTKKKRIKLDSRSDNNGILKRGDEEVQGLDGWTEDQEAALQRAYFSARPSPQFWKKVAKLVPGKSAQDCFDRIHADLATPQFQNRSRLCKSNSSPLGHFTLSSDKLLEYIDPNVKIPKRSRQKSLAAQKMVRKMLRKHHIADKSNEADLFSVLEAAANVSFQDLSQAKVPSTPDCVLKPLGFLQKCQGQSSSAHRKTRSKLKIVRLTDLASPPVLKQVKNMALHEKYIDQLHIREARQTRKASSQVKGNAAANMHTKGRGMLENDVRSARTALVSDAIDVMRQFKEMQSVDMGDYQYFSDEDDGDDNYDDGPC
ncbi:hypothetical protein ACLOJK_036159 [Asimina triloba]